jgi:bifunctional UDP-N-acetylglucosamine pyrophosphorylase / glucosamine-1-phosphate N-acetyltransferase
MADKPIAAIVLAAGKGTRMKTALPKVLHRLAGRPMIDYVLDHLKPLKCQPVVVVVSPGMEKLAAAVAPNPTAVQAQPLGTGHAVLAARAALQGFTGDVLVVYGDCPFISAETIGRMIARRRPADDPAVVVLGMRPADPAEYGRLVVGMDGMLEAIVEFRDASPEQRAITLCNSGVMAIDGKRLFGLLDRVGNANAKGEYYLTDIVEIARADGGACAVVEAPAAELIGINSRAELAAAEAILQERLRAQAMDGGTTLTDPQTVFLSFDTKLGHDVVVGPNVVFGPGVEIGNAVEIKPFCHIEGARIAANAVIGPFARLRPGTTVGERARIGNFVEAKNAALGVGAKANHLTYLGDAVVGAGANIGAGTITANYDGFNKHRTEIAADASIGSNTVLVAPLKVGRGAIVGAGSVVTQSVSPDALALARGRQVEKPGWAAKFRETKGQLGKGTVIKHGNRAFRVTVTASDGSILPAGPSNLRVASVPRPKPAPAAAEQAVVPPAVATEAASEQAKPPVARDKSAAPTPRPAANGTGVKTRKVAAAAKPAPKATAKPAVKSAAKPKKAAKKTAPARSKGRR